MSRIFKRPMFRKGGSTNGMTGIMSGIQDRQNYAEAGDVYPTDLGFGGFGQGTRSAEELGYDFDFAVPTFKKGDTRSIGDIRSEYEKELLAAAGERGGYDPVTTFLLQFGPSFGTDRSPGGLFARGLEASKVPIATMLKEKAEEDRFLRGIRTKAAGAAIEKKEAQDRLAMELENKLEVAKADVINKSKDLRNKIVANKELTDAERENLLTELAANRQNAIDRINAQYEGQLKIEKFKAENEGKEPDELQAAAKATIFEQDLQNYPNRPDVARRATDFKTGESSKQLYDKVGSRFGEVLTFDINDPKQAQANKKTLEGLRGKFVYDPFADKYHKITKDGKITYNSVEEINLDEKITLDDEDKKIKKPSTDIEEIFKSDSSLTDLDKKVIETVKETSEKLKEGQEKITKPFR